MKVAALCGPTASGKTALAVALRRDHGLPVEVLGVDALQLYRDLDAATAKPSADERAQVPTHLIDLVAPDEPMNAALWVAHAERVMAEVHARGNWPLFVGGTGLYLNALLRGLAAIPAVPQAVRDALAEEHAQRGAQALWQELQVVDPEYAAGTPPQNRQRLLRALEVWRHTGRPFSSYHAEHAAQPDRHACFLISLEPPRAALNDRIRVRAEAMAAPLLQEVAALRARGLPVTAPGLQAIGYRDAWQALDRGEPLRDFAGQLVAAHLAYAKKQQTWFRNHRADLRITSPDPQPVANALRAWFQG